MGWSTSIMVDHGTMGTRIVDNSSSNSGLKM